MKKGFLVIMALCVILVISACRAHPAIDSQMSIYKAELTEEEQALLKLVKMPYLWDFKVDETIESMAIVTYELIEGKWEPQVGGSQQLHDLKGRIALTFDNIAEGITIGSSHSCTSYTAECDMDFKGMSSTTSILSNPYPIVYEKEIPLVIQVHTTSNTISSLNPEYGFFELENYKNYEKVYAITVMFSQKTVEENEHIIY